MGWLCVPRRPAKVDDVVLVGSGMELELEVELVRGKRTDIAKPAMRPSTSLT